MRAGHEPLGQTDPCLAVELRSEPGKQSEQDGRREERYAGT